MSEGEERSRGLVRIDPEGLLRLVWSLRPFGEISLCFRKNLTAKVAEDLANNTKERQEILMRARCPSVSAGYIEY
ncbi:MAG: hypothetical protein DWQ47_05120 [Acidobacteria bacterium]|nr:MAG: hypothetical protein DWQ32_08670 [Acidobacteriota bacterium]REK01764.1 MAG: hypothetical protein DWQ38_05105 [Acidobacteriota bacterium]REK14720.1 MAG: hypothetical protein DWQ43_14360 [Acidobacteriota bacterium]REK45435.1 MAG: hypothetical protein DWQ47_05120 [Acidobacteriota bacterium]